MSDDWTDQVIQEMEVAWVEAVRTKQGQKARDNATSAVMQKYLRPGMTREDIKPLLRTFKENDYKVSEYRHEGAKNWPDGELRPYVDEEMKRMYQNRIPKGVSQFYITKEYGRARLIIVKFVGISFRIDDIDDRIIDVRASLSQSAI